MLNLVGNPLLLDSTSWNLIDEVDSYGNHPVTYPGGAGSAPDHWWTLGGPDYGSFLNAGAEWATTKITPLSGKSMLLDASNPLIQKSWGITQVVWLGHTEVQALKVSAACAAEGLLAPEGDTDVCPRILADVIGYPNQWDQFPYISSTPLRFQNGTYDFKSRFLTFIPNAPAKYLFFHIIFGGFTTGKAWFGDFGLEVVAMPSVQEVPAGNLALNSLFAYSSDGETPTAWTCVSAIIENVQSPLGDNCMNLSVGGVILQQSILVEPKQGKQKITIHHCGISDTIIEVTISLYSRFRILIGEKTERVLVRASQWVRTDIFVVASEYVEKTDIQITNIGSYGCYVGAAFLVQENYTPTSIYTIQSTKTQSVNIPTTVCNATYEAALTESINPKHLEIVPDTASRNNVLYAHNGQLGSMVPAKVIEELELYSNQTMTQSTSTEYVLGNWDDNIEKITSAGEVIEQYLRPPHVSPPDQWYCAESVDGVIPDGETRYYCVTAYNDNGETGRSNEVRAITATTVLNPDKNKVPIEITPVEGAAGYRVFLTKAEATEQPYDYTSGAIKALDWTGDCLVIDITAAELRTEGYIVYDTGDLVPQANRSPASADGLHAATNTATRWVVDTENQKIVFDAATAAKLTPAEMVAYYKQTAPTVDAVLYVGHSEKTYAVSGGELFYSDSYRKTKLYSLATSISPVDLDYHDSKIWHMASNGIVSDLISTQYIADGETYTGFCWLDATTIARIKSTGHVKLFDIGGSVLSEFDITVEPGRDFVGLSKYLLGMLAYDKTSDMFYQLSQSGQIIKSVDPPLQGITVWNVQGVHLAAYTDYGMMVYRLLASVYYGKLNRRDHYWIDPQYPTVHRERLPAEPETPTYPELLTNGSFEDGATWPVGFTVYSNQDAGYAVRYGYSPDVQVSGTKAMYFSFPDESWGSLASPKIAIIGGRNYTLSSWHKANVSTTCYIQYRFKDAEGQGSYTWVTVLVTDEYTLNETILKAPVDVVELEFVFRYYGESGTSIIYFLNSLSLKESEADTITFEHLFNGNFVIAAEGATMPSGWSIEGDDNAIAVAVTAIGNPIIQTGGKALLITMPPYTPELGWYCLQSMQFDVVEGDTLVLTYCVSQNSGASTSDNHSLYYFDVDGAWQESVHVTAAAPESGTVTVIFPANPANRPKALLRIWPDFGTTFKYEAISLAPKSDPNLVVNGDFSDELTGWTRNAYNMEAQLIDDIGSEITTAEYKSTPRSLRIKTNQTDYYASYAQQTMTLNQATAREVNIEAWAKGSNIVDGVCSFKCQLYVAYMDNTGEWNPAGFYLADLTWPTGDFDWTKKETSWTPSKAVKSIKTEFSLINWGDNSDNYIWLDDVSLEETLPVTSVDAVSLEALYTELRTSTLKQLSLSAQLMNNGQEVALRYADIQFSVSPDVGQLSTLKTNSVGKARVIFDLPDEACKITITAAYGALTDSAELILYPLIETRNLEPTLTAYPAEVSNVYMDIIVPKERKPLPVPTGRIGYWEVFRPTAMNLEQMPDYDIHYSPDGWKWNGTLGLDPDNFQSLYPELLYGEYFNHNSEYSTSVTWQEIMALRPEWACITQYGRYDHGGGIFSYNWKDLECCQWYIDRILRDKDTWPDMIYNDCHGVEEWYSVIVNRSPDWETKPSTYLNWATQKEHYYSANKFLCEYRDALHQEGFWLSPNLGTTRDQDPKTGTLALDGILGADPWDGYLLECWLYTTSLDPWETISDEGAEEKLDVDGRWRNELEFLIWCRDHDKWVAVLVRNRPYRWGARMFSLATFLLGKHDKAFYCIGYWGSDPEDTGLASWYDPYGSNWHESLYPECKIKTGEPLEEYQEDDLLFSRRFEKCIAILNHNEAEKAYQLPEGTWYDLRGNSYTESISLEWRRSTVLVQELP